MRGRFTCVLVDDDVDFLELEKHYLRGSCPDVEVLAFTAGQNAISYLRHNPVDLIVTDYRMPGMSGVDFTRAVRLFAAAVPILVVSDDEIKNDALNAGATLFMRKDVFRLNHRAIIDDLLLERERSRANGVDREPSAVGRRPAQAVPTGSTSRNVLPRGMPG